MEELSLTRLCLLMLRLANLTFGGGNPTMAAMHQEIVSARKWLSQEKFATSYALARITPGTNVLACCAAVSWSLLGWPAAMLTVLAASIPGAIVVIVLTGSYEAVRSNHAAMGAITGMLAGAVGMMWSSAWELLKPHLKRSRWLPSVVISGGSLVLSLRFGMTPIEVLALAALVGCVWRIHE